MNNQMNYIGIDMSKDTFHAALEEGKVCRFKNTKEGIEEFMTTIENIFPIQSTKIGVEATGAYHLLFAVTLTEHSWPVAVINPLESHKIIFQGLRTVKTDKLDAEKIRLMVAMGKGYIFTDIPEVLTLKALVVERQSLVKTRRMIKQRMIDHQLKEQAVGFSFHDSFSSILEVLSHEIKKIEQTMITYEPETQKLLRSIPGIGQTDCSCFSSSFYRRH